MLELRTVKTVSSEFKVASMLKNGLISLGSNDFKTFPNLSYFSKKINVNRFSQNGSNSQIWFSQFFARFANGYMANPDGNHEIPSL